MASGSQFMTTYYAKRIMGDNAASTADQALLQTGYGITVDTWILNRTNRPNYGILYHYDSNGADKIKFIGGINNTNDIETAWIQLDAGDTYILGRVGIGWDPTVNNNPYKLYINGTTYANAPVYINNSTAVAMEDDNGALVIGDKAGLNIGIDNCKVHARNNSAAANLLLNSEGGNILLGVDDDDYYVNIRSEQDASSTSTGALRVGGGAGITKKLYVGDDIHSDGHLYFAAAKNIYMNYNGIDYPILENSDDSNIILNAATGILNIGHKNTIGINMYYSTNDSTRTQFFTINSNGAYANTRFGVNGQDTNYTLYVNGTSYFTDHMYIGRNDSAHIYLINKNWTKGTNPSSQTYSAVEYNDVNNSRVALLEATLDTSGNSQFNIFLVPNVASSTSWSGIILQKTNANVLTVNIAGTTTVSGTVHADGGYLKSTVNNNTVTIGSQNSGCCHIYNSADIPFAFNRGFLMVNSGDIGSSSYPTGDIIVKSGGRISGNGGALYLGNSGNQNWVYVQDMCSQDGQKWKIHQNGNAEFNGTVTAPTFSGNATSATYLKDRTNNNATYANYGAAGLAASAISWLTCWNGYELRAISKAETMAAVRGAASGSWAISVTGSSASCTGNANTANYQNCVATNEIRYARNGNMTSANDLWQGWAFAEGKVAVINGWRFGNGNGGLAPIYGSKVYNAVWNDFAEYRVSDITEGGRVLVSDGKGHLVLSTERLQPSARVISDTFGCSVGMSDSAKTPIGVAGRVLVYPYQPRENYKVGDALCAAPNGTADIMTREEIIQYPDRIIGIVDEVPDYEIWDQVHTNKKDDGEVGEQNHTNIEVNGRIWIYVR